MPPRVVIGSSFILPVAMWLAVAGWGQPPYSLVDLHLVNLRNTPAYLPELLPASYIPEQRNSSPNAAEEAQTHWERGYALARRGDLENADAELQTALSLSPNNVQYVYMLGIVAARRGDLQRAATLFQQGLKLQPGNLQIRQDLAAAEWQLGKLRQAATNLGFILERKPHDKDASLLLGMVLENQGEYKSAIGLLRAAQDKLPLHPEALAALLHSYYETSRLADAHNLEESILNGPSPLQSVFLATTVAEDAGDFQFADKLLTVVHNSDPSSLDIEYQLAVLRYRMGNYAEAEGILKALIDRDNRTAQYFNLLGWCLAKRRDIPGAVKAFDHAIDLGPQKVSNYVDVATVLEDAGLLPGALQAADKAVEIDPRSYDAYRVKGRIEMRQHNYVAAVNSYTHAVSLNDRSPDLLVELANAQAAAGLFERASQTFELAIKRYPLHAQSYYDYALLMLHHSGSDRATSQTKVASLLKKSLTLDESLVGARYELGNIWLAQGQYTQALAELRKAAKLAPWDRDIHYALWVVLRKLGRTQEAADELRIFKAANDKNDNKQK